MAPHGRSSNWRNGRPGGGRDRGRRCCGPRHLISRCAASGFVAHLGIEFAGPDDGWSPRRWPRGAPSCGCRPRADLFPVVVAAAVRGAGARRRPSLAQAEALAQRLDSFGLPSAVVPRRWAQAAAGAAAVLGARARRGLLARGCPPSSCWTGTRKGLQQEAAPTWNAWVVGAERARRAGVPCVVVSSCPTVELLAWRGATVLAPSREQERAGWAPPRGGGPPPRRPPGRALLAPPDRAAARRGPGSSVSSTARAGSAAGLRHLRRAGGAASDAAPR